MHAVKSTRLNTRINAEVYPNERCTVFPRALSTEHNFVDPVCRMKVEKSSNVPAFVYESDTYHFCTDSCRKAFMANPDRYLKAETTPRKGFWNRYLDRLNKATGVNRLVVTETIIFTGEGSVPWKNERLLFRKYLAAIAWPRFKRN